MAPLHIVLVHPEIPWNTGNAGRTCLAAGAQLHLVEPLGFSLDERHVRRAGVDYWRHVSPTLWHCWDDFADALPSLGEPYLLSAEADHSLWDIQIAQPAVLVFGSESAGLPPSLRQRYRDHLVALPMTERRVRSLNLSTAVGIAAYETLRQWHQTPSP